MPANWWIRFDSDNFWLMYSTIVCSPWWCSIAKAFGRLKIALADCSVYSLRSRRRSTITHSVFKPFQTRKKVCATDRRIVNRAQPNKLRRHVWLIAARRCSRTVPYFRCVNTHYGKLPPGPGISVKQRISGDPKWRLLWLSPARLYHVTQLAISRIHCCQFLQSNAAT